MKRRKSCILRQYVLYKIRRLQRCFEVHEVWNLMYSSHSSGVGETIWMTLLSRIREIKVSWGTMYSEEHMRQVNHTFVALIPKVKELENMQQIRPISLCNVIYKLGSKVLANRLKGLLQDVIAPNQSAFVPGRQISDNSLLAFEISHYMKRCYGGRYGYGALKLDMAKAYDRVEWPFLEAVMVHMGFDRRWIGWIMECVMTVSYSFVLNGEPRGRLLPSRGLRQGDSISPYLFLLCAEGLSRMLSRAELLGRFHGVAIAPGAPSINHLFFADDSFIFMRATREECLEVSAILHQYEQASGQRVSLQKSSVCFSKNVARAEQDELAALLGVERVPKHDKYLGLPTEVSYSKSDAFQFIMEKTKNKMKNWKDKMLSTAGKEVLIKAVVQSVPTYVMSCFELPKHMCEEMHRCMAEFWWGDSERGRKIHWMSWDRMCIPKEDGGLGFRNMWQFNYALLAKQGWRLLRFGDSLLARSLKAKYYPDTSFLQATAGSGASYAWRSLMKGKEVLCRGARYLVGSGADISVWSDPWLPRPYSFRPCIPVMEGLEELKVSDLIDVESRGWDFAWLEELFTPDEVDMIKCMPLGRRSGEDKLIWHFTKNGEYCVKSGYKVARACESLGTQVSSSSRDVGVHKLWKRVWHARVLPKVRSFVWRLLKDILPTRVALAKKRVNLEEVCCLFCRGEEESSLHLFKNCNAVACLWLLCPLGLRARNQAVGSLWEWVEGMVNTLKREEVDIFFMCLWSIWEARNKLLWQGGVFNPQGAVLSSMKLLQDYYACHPQLDNQAVHRVKIHKWVAPPSGRLKLNCDGAFQEESCGGGVGVVVRDDGGSFVAAVSQSLQHLSSALHSEAEVCRLGLLTATQQGWRDIELESDCSIAVAALNKVGSGSIEVCRIFDDCFSMMSMFNTCVIRHVNRKVNSVADRLARFASRGHVVDLIFDEAPSFIQDVLYEDECNVAPIQGPGFMSPLDS